MSKLLSASLLATLLTVGASSVMATPPALGQGQAVQQHSQNAPANRQAIQQQMQAKRADIQAKKAACGDINGDGVQNAQDATLCSCDTNGDKQLSDDEKAACKTQAQTEAQAKATTAKANVQTQAAAVQSGSTTSTTSTTTTQ